MERNSRQDQRFRSLVESTDDWLWEMSETGVYTYASPQVQDILGYSPAEVLGKTPFDLMSPKEAERVAALFGPLFRDREPFRLLENDNLSRDGRVVRIETSGRPFFDDSGVFRGYRGIDRDISERRPMERERASFEAVLSEVAEAALILDRAANITYLNPAFYTLFGYSPLEIMGKHISALGVPGTSPDTQPPDVIRHLDEDGHWQGEVERLANDGERIPVLLRARVLRDDAGSFEGYLGTYLDLRDIKRNERRLEQAVSGVIESLAATMEKRDPYTANHQYLVASLCKAIGRELGLGESVIRGMELGAMIHNIGNVYVPMEILNRPGPLTDQEFRLIQTHTSVGVEILGKVDFDWPIQAMVSQHHERLDGSGYPLGLAGTDIIEEARIIAVADVIQALISHRPYRSARGSEAAIHEIRAHRGTLFDANVVDAAMAVASRGHLSAERHIN